MAALAWSLLALALHLCLSITDSHAFIIVSTLKKVCDYFPAFIAGSLLLLLLLACFVLLAVCEKMSEGSNP